MKSAIALLLIGSVICISAAEAKLPSGYKLLYEQNFDKPDAIRDFVMTDPGAWKISAANDQRALELTRQSQYKPLVRSPVNIALIADKVFSDFVLEADLIQTGREYGHRDMCIFYGVQNPTNFYYTHIATAADPNAHNIFIVKDAPRKNIAKETTKGVNWGLNDWHKVRLERDTSAGTIKVYFDDFSKPIMTAEDRNFANGYIGFGSFDDTGMIDNIRIWGREVQTKRVGFFSSPQVADASKPLKALLIAGGCCHEYGTQKDVLKNGIEARARVEVDMVYSADTSTKARFDIYEKADWAKGYDVIIHDECSSDVKEIAYVQNILNAHRTVPAVNLHCAMHSYRVGTDDWFRFVGIQSSAHGPQEPIEVKFVDSEHPITKRLSNWTTIKEELYNNLKQFETAHPLARGKQVVKQRDGSTKEVEYVVAWANDYHGTRVFSTTLGHNTATVADDRYLDLVTRGLLWACDKLNSHQHKAAASAKN